MSASLSERRTPVGHHVSQYWFSVISFSLATVLSADWGISLSQWRNFVCLPLLIVLPLSLTAEDTPGALLRSNGTGVLVNRNPAPASIALFRDDLVETQQNAVARIESTGSDADIGPETMVQFEGDELFLDHGSVSVDTNRGLRVRVGCLTVVPVQLAAWTHYEVVDVNGKVTVSALKGDVNIEGRSGTSPQAKPSAQSDRATVREGEQKSREDKCAGGYTNSTVPPPGQSAILNSTWAKMAGVVGVGALICLGLCHNDDPISPNAP